MEDFMTSERARQDMSFDGHRHFYWKDDAKKDAVINS